MTCLVRVISRKMSNLELSGSRATHLKSHLPCQVSPADEFIVQFWGVRGLIPTPSSNTSRYGGNTACVEMHVAGKRLIFDGGTGLRILGKTSRLQQPLEAHLFFTNCQSNRIQGFPFFAPHLLGKIASIFTAQQLPMEPPSNNVCTIRCYSRTSLPFTGNAVGIAVL